MMKSSLAGRDTGLGGKLFFAGELDGECHAFITAANIACAATLAASADRSAQKQALRDGIADFLVATLDEALRILKNQLRKREPAAVCVGAPPAEVEAEMLARGVLPDLTRDASTDFARNVIPTAQLDGALPLSAAALSECDAETAPAILTWSVASAPAQWLPKLDAIALASLDADDWIARRWLRLSPRYLGRLTQGIHAVTCSRRAASSFIQRVQRQVDSGVIGVPVEIRWREQLHKLD